MLEDVLMDTTDGHLDVGTMDMIIPPKERTTKRKTMNSPQPE